MSDLGSAAGRYACPGADGRLCTIGKRFRFCPGGRYRNPGASPHADAGQHGDEGEGGDAGVLDAEQTARGAVAQDVGLASLFCAPVRTGARV